MNWDFDKLENQAKEDIRKVSSLKELEEYRIQYLGKKGIIAEIFGSLATVSKEEKPIVGKRVNDLRKLVTDLIEVNKGGIKKEDKKASIVSLDATAPGIARSIGKKHVLTQTMDEICSIFESMGFVLQDGPECETEFNNFTALNIPEDHPSRDGFDTFYLDQANPLDPKTNLLLRSHTSPGQIRIMQEYKPPLAVIIPGKVYRPDAVDASHSFMFHQIEGLLVDKDIKFSDLKGLLSAFLKKLFGPDIKMRFRPHFFPFTEPSAEVDVSCYICKGQGCSVCKRNGWLEIMGCGMVNPKVFEYCGYDPTQYTGLAFGLGVERLTMLKYGINDIRLFSENDVRFLHQF